MRQSPARGRRTWDPILTLYQVPAFQHQTLHKRFPLLPFKFLPCSNFLLSKKKHPSNKSTPPSPITEIQCPGRRSNDDSTFSMCLLSTTASGFKQMRTRLPSFPLLPWRFISRFTFRSGSNAKIASHHPTFSTFSVSVCSSMRFSLFLCRVL